MGGVGGGNRMARHQRRRSPEPEASAHRARRERAAPRSRLASLCRSLAAACRSSPRGDVGSGKKKKRSKALGTDSRLLDSVARPPPPILRSLVGRYRDRRDAAGGAGSPGPPEFAPRPEPLDFVGAVLGKGGGARGVALFQCSGFSRGDPRRRI